MDPNAYLMCITMCIIMFILIPSLILTLKVNENKCSDSAIGYKLY